MFFDDFTYSEHLVYETLNCTCRVDDDDICDATGDASYELMEEGKTALKRFVSDLAGHQNFMWFTAMNLVQVCVHQNNVQLCSPVKSDLFVRSVVNPGILCGWSGRLEQSTT